MSVQLCSAIPAVYSKAAVPEIIFENEQNIVREHTLREQPKLGIPGKSCETALFFGFFFDGTRNNYEPADKGGKRNHSNVARLYDSFPALSAPGVHPKTTEWACKPERRHGIAGGTSPLEF